MFSTKQKALLSYLEVILMPQSLALRFPPDLFHSHFLSNIQIRTCPRDTVRVTIDMWRVYLLEGFVSWGMHRCWLKENDCMSSLRTCKVDVIPSENTTLIIRHMAWLKVCLEVMTSWWIIVVMSASAEYREHLHHALWRSVFPLAECVSQHRWSRGVILIQLTFICYRFCSNLPAKIIHISYDYKKYGKHAYKTWILHL